MIIHLPVRSGHRTATRATPQPPQDAWLSNFRPVVPERRPVPSVARLKGNQPDSAMDFTSKR